MGTVFGLPSFYSYFNLAVKGPGAAHTNDILGCELAEAIDDTYDPDIMMTAMNGLYSGGGIFGCLGVPWLANSLGRKPTIQITCIVCIVAAVLQCGAVHVAMLLVGRFLGGLG